MPLRYHMHPRILVVGAGPTGLLGAIHIKEKHPNLTITLLERNYPRTHEVEITPANIGNVDLRNEVMLHGKYTLKDASKGVRVRVDDLRDILINFAIRLGLVIVSIHVEFVEQLRELYPDCKTIIIAEGAHSKLRGRVFGADNKNLDQYPFQNIVQMQYVTPGRVNKLSFGALHRAEQLSDFLFEESVSYHEAEQTSKVTARFFVPDGVYASIPTANQAHPLDPSVAPESIQNACSTWMNARNDNGIVDSRITKFELHAHCARSFTKIQDGINWILIGDSAFTIPYFRALNAGTACASNLPNWIEGFLLRLSNDRFTVLRAGERHTVQFKMFQRFIQELVAASVKDAMLESTKSLVFVSGSVMSSSNADQTRALHPVFLTRKSFSNNFNFFKVAIHGNHPVAR